MKLKFTVTVELRRTEGAAAEREELEAQIIDALHSADPGTLEGSDGGEYEVLKWDTDAVVPKQKPLGGGPGLLS